jgi:uncharacterized repeat protein (TIGR03803 family)
MVLLLFGSNYNRELCSPSPRMRWRRSEYLHGERNSFRPVRLPFPLIEGKDGNLYGTASGGGAQSFGAVFRITPSGAGTVLYSFGAGPSDGQNPSGALVLASDGNFYGTTLAGGMPNANCKASNGCGTLYRITPSGTETVLYSFGTNAGDGIGPSGALLQASDGNLYGTTTAGGTANAGTVFKLVLGTTP